MSGIERVGPFNRFIWGLCYFPGSGAKALNRVLRTMTDWVKLNTAERVKGHCRLRWDDLIPTSNGSTSIQKCDSFPLCSCGKALQLWNMIPEEEIPQFPPLTSIKQILDPSYHPDKWECHKIHFGNVGRRGNSGGNLILNSLLGSCNNWSLRRRTTKIGRRDRDLMIEKPDTLFHVNNIVDLHSIIEFRLGPQERDSTLCYTWYHLGPLHYGTDDSVALRVPLQQSVPAQHHPVPSPLYVRERRRSSPNSVMKFASLGSLLIRVRKHDCSTKIPHSGGERHLSFARRQQPFVSSAVPNSRAVFESGRPALYPSRSRSQPSGIPFGAVMGSSVGRANGCFQHIRWDGRPSLNWIRDAWERAGRDPDHRSKMVPSPVERSETGRVCRASSACAGRILREPGHNKGKGLPGVDKHGEGPAFSFKIPLFATLRYAQEGGRDSHHSEKRSRYRVSFLASRASSLPTPVNGSRGDYTIQIEESARTHSINDSHITFRSHLMKGWLSEMDSYREVKDGMEEVDLLAYHHLSHGIDFCHGKGMKVVRTKKDWTFNDPTREYLQSTTPCSPLRYEEKGAAPLFINSGTLQLTGAKGLGHNATDLKKLWLNPIKEANATGRAEQWFNHPHLRDTFPIPSLPLLKYRGHLAQGIRDGPGRSISVLLALRDRRGYGQNLAYQDFAGLFWCGDLLRKDLMDGKFAGKGAAACKMIVGVNSKRDEPSGPLLVRFVLRFPVLEVPIAPSLRRARLCDTRAECVEYLIQPLHGNSNRADFSSSKYRDSVVHKNTLSVSITSYRCAPDQMFSQSRLWLFGVEFPSLRWGEMSTLLSREGKEAEGGFIWRVEMTNHPLPRGGGKAKTTLLNY
eukprot:Gb_23639 [translate_table: standard]